MTKPKYNRYEGEALVRIANRLTRHTWTISRYDSISDTFVLEGGQVNEERTAFILCQEVKSFRCNTELGRITFEIMTDPQVDYSFPQYTPGYRLLLLKADYDTGFVVCRCVSLYAEESLS